MRAPAGLDACRTLALLQFGPLCQAQPAPAAHDVRVLPFPVMER
jgi:hypothetical protein